MKPKVGWLIALAAALLSGAGIAVGAIWLLCGPFIGKPQAGIQFDPAQTASEPVVNLPVLFNVPSFAYPDQDGQMVSNANLRGHPWICDFIYTRCTTACPILTARMILLQRSIQNPDIKFVSFTVDPVYDNPAVLKSYAELWHGDESRWRLLATGTDAAVHATALAMDLAMQRVSDPLDPIMHSNRFGLFDSAGRARGLYDSTDPDAVSQLVKDANALIAAGQPELLEPADETAATISLSSPVTGGGHLFMVMGCAACHAQARIAPALDGLAGAQVKLNDGRTVVADDAYIRESIVDPNAKIVAGYGPTMPNYRAYLNDAQVDAILAYIKSTRAAAGATASETRILVIDPVCGMQVSAGSDTPDFVYGGTKYYFCSQSCLEKFQNDPSKYVKP